MELHSRQRKPNYHTNPLAPNAVIMQRTSSASQLLGFSGNATNDRHIGPIRG